MTFQVNHLGPFLLTQLLREQLAAGNDARVVNVASDAHKSARRGLDFDDLQSTRRYRSFGVYGKTKLANILFTRELARRWDDTGVTANVVHPGFVASSFGRDGDTGRLGALVFPLLKPFALSPEQGAADASVRRVRSRARRHHRWLLGEVRAGDTERRGAGRRRRRPPLGGQRGARRLIRCSGTRTRARP